jgi:multidrug efflux pump subunit AcrA (membrane-fusion protein)
MCALFVAALFTATTARADEPKPPATPAPQAAAPKPVEPPKTPPPAAPPVIPPVPPVPPVAQAPVAPPAPPHHVVKKEPFKIDLTLNGVFEAKTTHEVQLKPEAWQVWMVTKVADHGARVKKGDIILQFDTKQIDEVIKDVEAGRAIADLEYQAAQEQLSMMEETVPLDLAAAERAKQYFDEDLKRYFEVQVPIARRMAEESLKSVENFLAYEKEELRQLEKMYKADDLTEETEEIVLKRQRDTIARLEFNLERAKLSRDEAIKVSIPREELQVKNSEKISEIRVRNARSNFPRLLAQQRLTVQKMTREREKGVEQLKKLRKDRAAMTVKAPIDGIVYYGQSQRGAWNMVGPMTQMLGDGSPLKPGMILLTVVAPRPVVVRTTVAEGALFLARPGIAGKLTPVGFGDVSVPAKLESVGAVPLAPGTFDAVVAAPLDAAAQGSEAIVPGMNCSVKLIAYEKKDALTVPSTVVQSDEADEAKKFVYLLEADNKNRKQDVKLGKSAGGKTEILTGIKEGDRILLNKP